MKLNKIYEDTALTNSLVPEGYLLVFMGYSTGAVGGDIVKRYKNHSGEFGTLAGEVTDSITDEEANTLITTSTTASEQGAEDVAAMLVSSTAISTQLDSIIGE